MENVPYNHQVALARKEDLVVQELPEEVMVYDLKRHKAHCLNKTAALVWHHCDGQTTITEMTRLLQQEAGSPVDEEVVWYALDRLSEANLLEEKVASPVKDSLSRRRMMRRLGTLLVVPTVVSLIAPMAVQAATVFIAPSKIADGSCTPPGPLPPAGCLTGETCCSGSKQVCMQTSPTTTACAGQPCEPAGAASDC